MEGAVSEEYRAFAEGFLKQAVQEGLTVDQAIDRLTHFVTHQRRQKQAFFGSVSEVPKDLTASIKNLTDAGSNVLSSAANLGGLALLATAGGSYGLGRVLPHLTDISEEELEEERLRDLSEEYRRAATIAHQNAEAGHYRKTRRSAVRGRAL